jgi:cellulose synthase/poly-beta-1,6-N-acetylglucosamine synthase-like glycosyltransferase
VALCVCAYNEERVIRAKADNMVSMRKAVPGLELLVYVDAASDRTVEILRDYEGEITVVASPTRQGKTHGMNTLVQGTNADFVVFSDANVLFAPDAIPRLLQRFDDPEVGCVCGHLVYTRANDSATAVTGSLYWRLEEAIKELETRSGSTMGADGSIFAIRRALHRPPPPDIIDDMYVSLSILCGGHRVMRVNDALAYEEATTHAGDEFRRKVRIACQAFNAHRLMRADLAKLSPLNRYKYVSHKLLRWFTAYLLSAAALCFVAGLAVLGAWVLLVQCVLAGAALLVIARLRPAGPFGKLVDIAAAFLATGLGVARSVRGERFQVWTPPASARG